MHYLCTYAYVHNNLINDSNKASIQKGCLDTFDTTPDGVIYTMNMAENTIGGKKMSAMNSFKSF